jgi:hypothetical protein
MSSSYTFEQRRLAYLKTKAGSADTVTIVLALLPAALALLPLFVYVDNIVIGKVVGTFVGVIVYVIVYSLIQRPVFRFFYAKNLKAMK